MVVFASSNCSTLHRHRCIEPWINSCNNRNCRSSSDKFSLFR